jgi:hypothetical protein
LRGVIKTYLVYLCKSTEVLGLSGTLPHEIVEGACGVNVVGIHVDFLLLEEESADFEVASAAGEDQRGTLGLVLLIVDVGRLGD